VLNCIFSRSPISKERPQPQDNTLDINELPSHKRVDLFACCLLVRFFSTLRMSGTSHSVSSFLCSQRAPHERFHTHTSQPKNTQLLIQVGFYPPIFSITNSPDPWAHTNTFIRSYVAFWVIFFSFYLHSITYRLCLAYCERSMYKEHKWRDEKTVQPKADAPVGARGRELSRRVSLIQCILPTNLVPSLVHLQSQQTPSNLPKPLDPSIEPTSTSRLCTMSPMLSSAMTYADDKWSEGWCALPSAKRRFSYHQSPLRSWSLAGLDSAHNHVPNDVEEHKLKSWINTSPVTFCAPLAQDPDWMRPEQCTLCRVIGWVSICRLLRVVLSYEMLELNLPLEVVWR